MAEGRSVVQRVQELKERLGYAEEPAEIIKTLKVLQDLDISLHVLVETGIGKTVNSFRKHATAGNIAKTLVKQWKKLTASEDQSAHRGRKQNTEKDEAKSSISEKTKRSGKSKTSVLVSRSSNSAPISKKLDKQHTCSGKTHQSRDVKSQKQCDNKECSSSGSDKQHTCSKKTHQSRDFESLKKSSSSGSDRAFQGTNPQAKKSDFKEKGIKKVSAKQCSSVVKDFSFLKEKPSKDVSKQINPKHLKQPKQNLVIKRKAELSSDEEFEPPAMSFESYLNYDQVPAKRKKACSTGRQPKKCNKQKSSSLLQKASAFSHANEGEKDVKTSEGDQSETPNKKAKMASLQDLLNTPLPKVLTGISISSPPYAADFETSLEPVEEAPEKVREAVQFTGQRLNSKMQVYSGPKTVHLSKMLTLYEQCIRVLQNNIDSLHEVGSVPFEILEPVLTRCTPEQLFRIEESNPTFAEKSDLLWKKHCQRDFKNEGILECESWREMYSRLFNQREEKLKTLTKNIISAQSEKPKGRQVIMAYVTSAAKPPRNIRQQQETRRTAGPVTQLRPREKSKRRTSESRDVTNTSAPIAGRNCGSSSSSMMTQDEKKPMKRVGPIMKKTLKALKSKAG